MSFNIQFESEKHVFECIIKNPALMYDIDPKWLSVKGQEVYNAIGYLVENKVSLNSDTLYVQTNDEDIKQFIKDLFDANTSDIRDFEVYKQRLKVDHVREQISDKLSTDLKVLVNKRGDLDLKKVEELSQLLESNLDLIYNDRRGISPITDVTRRYNEELTLRMSGKFYSYGDALLDSVTVGAQPGQMTTIFGPSSMGKSAFALNLFNKQINKRIPSAYFTLEMDETSTMDRLISLRTGIPAAELLMKNSDGQEKAYLKDIVKSEIDKINKMEGWMYLLDEPGLKLTDFESKIIKLKKRMGVNYMIVFVDLWTMFSDIKADASDIEEAINITHALVKRQNIHLLPIVQANRKADDKSPASIELIPQCKIRNMNAIKNSAAIGERSRTVLSVFRAKRLAELYFPENPLTEAMDDIFEATILKCSNGKIGSTVKYVYQPECFRITPYIEEEHISGDYE